MELFHWYILDEKLNFDQVEMKTNKNCLIIKYTDIVRKKYYGFSTFVLITK